MDALFKGGYDYDTITTLYGPSGSGKSSTLAAMINIINTERKAHIITIEEFERNETILSTLSKEEIPEKTKLKTEEHAEL